ncbi:tetratricopeptide repeat-containing sulfotransferase family protein [Maritimibacter sp. HL-12]|uniref:tetratricopeptide repeat-containing sulfotransferase family protein n=1 Tax=Maritimibacter sp. HL-12 TaxID=1162418 RepID=UPI000A0F2A71|nr:tetratricopeptide repeat-containing sulfotransferase family protein [Maritimibacter sp. HL-12]SMH49706.1 Tetratricopeptide (TPR) repeat [Maritimibacter sp. HL-12]
MSEPGDRASEAGRRLSPPPEALANLQDLLMSGAVARALELAERLAEQYPGHARVENMLGLAQMQSGQVEPALAAFARATTADPGFAGAYINRANLLVALGRFSAAVPICEAVLAVVAGGEEAAKAHHLLAVAHANTGAPVAAEGAFRAAIAAHPDMVAAHGGLGGLLATLGRFDEAVAVLEAAARRWPDDTSIARNLGTVLIELGRFEAAVDVLEPAGVRNPEDAPLQTTCVRALRGAGRVEAALKAAEAAIRAEPRSAEAHGLLGSCRRALGDTTGAIAAYDAALELAPDDPTALVARWRMSPLPPGHPARERIAARLADPATTPDLRCALELVLFEADDKAGDIELAFEHLMRAGRAKRAARPYDITAQARMFEAIQGMFGAPIAPLEGIEPAPVRPVFIVGMPRSGTSLVEQILASHPSVLGGGELPVLGRAMAEAGWGAGRIGAAPSAAMLGRLRRTYLDALAALDSTRPVITDKTPMNFRWLGFALAALPEARVLVMQRDARATCFSNLTHDLSGRANDFGADMVDTAEMYRLHLDLVGHWQRHYPDRISTVPYERLTENPEAESRALVAAAGLNWDPACLAFHETRRVVRTASAEQVRQPIYTGSSEAWRRYERHLGPMLERLKGL